MNRRIALFLSTVGLGVVAVSWWSEPTPELPSQFTPVRADAGTELYDLSWRTQTATRMPGSSEALHVDVALRGALAVSRAGDVSMWQLRDVSALSFTLDGHGMPLEAATLTSPVVRVQGDDVTVQGQADIAIRHLLEALVRTANAQPTDGTYTTPYGTAEHRWSLRGDEMIRTTHAYTYLRSDPAREADTTVTGTGTMKVDSQGRMTSWTAHEHITSVLDGQTALSVDDRLTLTASSQRTPPVRPLAHLPTPATDPSAPLIDRAAGLSAPTLLTRLGSYTGGSDADSAELMWRGTARIALDPQAARDVAAVASQDDAPLATRELALDLLAHAPSVDAQLALVEALSTDSIVQHEAYPMLLQRLSFATAPTAQAAALVTDAMDGSDAEVAHAASHTAGAMSRQAARAGDDALADALADRLVEGARTGDDQARAAALSGLGNAGRDEDMPVVLEAMNASATVRRAAVLALRAWSGRQVDEALLVAVSDTESTVRRAALTALEGRALPDTALRTLYDHTTAELVPANLDLLVTVLAPHADNAHARLALANVVQQAHASPQLRARVRAILTP